MKVTDIKEVYASYLEVRPQILKEAKDLLKSLEKIGLEIDFGAREAYILEYKYELEPQYYEVSIEWYTFDTWFVTFIGKSDEGFRKSITGSVNFLKMERFVNLLLTGALNPKTIYDDIS